VRRASLSIIDNGLNLFLTIFNTLPLPSRNLNRENVMRIYDFAGTKLKELLQTKGEVKFFSCTSDIWSSRTMEAFLALTIHYLTDDFEMKKFVLKVDPVIRVII